MLILYAILLIAANSIRIQPIVDPHSSLCFYEHFYLQIKYRFYLSPKNQSFSNYTFQLQYLINETADPKVIYHHEASSAVDQEINIHKFASEEGIHGFCIQNNEPKQLAFKMKLQSGIELLQLDVLPGASQTQLLDGEIKLLQDQYKSVLDSLTSIQSSKAMTQQIFEMMSSKTLGFGIIGIGVIVLINAIFYKLIKKTLQDRKRI